MVGYLHLGILNGHAMPYHITFSLVKFYLPCYGFLRRFATINPLKHFQGHSTQILCEIKFLARAKFFKYTIN